MDLSDVLNTDPHILATGHTGTNTVVIITHHPIITSAVFPMVFGVFIILLCALHGMHLQLVSVK